NSLFEGFLRLARFPFLDWQPISVVDLEVLIDQSFSDFGDADAVLLIDTGSEAVSIFVEAKVKPFQKGQWTAQEEFNKFKAGLESTVSSSNLFTQLYHKVRLVRGLRKGGLDALIKGINFPKSSFKRIRKIGNNQVVLRAVKRIEEYLDKTLYIGIVPDEPSRIEAFFHNILKNSAPEGYMEWDVTNYGYMCWEEIEAFCAKNGLKNTLGVFAFNRGGIYGSTREA
ncbi:MAG: hypothetical protein GTO24_12675, partial [candidate division Zixibacteria bacterium]|nr:hypothetical protein [candidate division Zixibacteria bacterium]